MKPTIIHLPFEFETKLVKKKINGIPINDKSKEDSHLFDIERTNLVKALSSLDNMELCEFYSEKEVDNLFAKTLLTVKHYQSIVKQYTKYIDAEVEYFNDIRNFITLFNTLFSEYVEDEKTSHLMSIDGGNKSIRDMKIAKTPKQKGGEIYSKLEEIQSDKCLQSIIYDLEMLIPDSLHDFGKSSEGRNNSFPKNGESNRAQKVLEIFKKFLIPKGSYPSKLSDYYEGSPNNFEEDVKVAYLLNKMCDNIKVSYYFSTKDFPTSWSDDRTNFFKKTPPNSIEKLYAELKDRRIEKWILDACMTVQKNFPENGITQLNSLCCLWDGAGSESLSLAQVDACDNMKDKLTLVKESSDSRWDYHNSVLSSNKSRSLYDFVYDDLLNTDLYPKLESKPPVEYSLRLATLKNNKLRYYVALKISQTLSTSPITYKHRYFVLEKGGFSVKVLSYGLRYIEENRPVDYIESIIETQEGDKSDDIYEQFKKLKEIIDHIASICGLSGIQQMYYLWAVILRFKSSGDHGTSKTTTFFNKILKIGAIFLSGDALAGIYGLAYPETPTLINYYSSPKKEGDYVHFLVMNIPIKETLESIHEQIKKEKYALAGLVNPFVSDWKSTISFEVAKTKVKNAIDAIETQTVNKAEISDALIPHLNKVENYKEIYVAKYQLREWEELRKKVFVLFHYEQIKEITNREMEKEVESLQEIARVNTPTPSLKLVIDILNETSRTSRTGILTTHTQSLTKKLNDGFTEQDFLNSLEQITGKGEKDSLLDRFRYIKAQQIKRLKAINETLEKKLRITTSQTVELKAYINKFQTDYRNSVKDQLQQIKPPELGEAITNFFYGDSSTVKLPEIPIIPDPLSDLRIKKKGVSDIVIISKTSDKSIKTALEKPGVVKRSKPRVKHGNPSTRRSLQQSSKNRRETRGGKKTIKKRKNP